MILLSMTVNGMAAMQDVLADARAYGARLAQMLTSSLLPQEVQDSWAALIPSMTLPQLQHFELLLRAHMNGEAQKLLEDALLEIKAEVTKHDLAIAGRVHAAHRELDVLEREIDALERAGGKKSE
jgi:uncharacterized protein Yka (UPF0111/DUF47 family)